MDFNEQFRMEESQRGDQPASKKDVQAIMEKLDATQRVMLRLLEEVKLLQNTRSQTPNTTKSHVLPQNPFSNKESFLNFEKNVESSEEQFFNLVTEFKEQVSGNSQKFITNCWRKLMGDDVAQSFCWQGSVSKTALKALSTTLAIKLAYNDKFSDHTDAEFEKCTIAFFQQAKNRFYKKISRNNSSTS